MSQRFSGYVVDLPTYEKKNLPSGTWVRLRNLNPATTEEDISKMILERTGVEIPPTAIQMNAFSIEHSGALVSFDKHAINALVTWALSEAELHGRPVVVTPPLKSATW